MDRNLRNLERIAYSSGDISALNAYFHRLKSLGRMVPMQEFHRLGSAVESLIPLPVQEDDQGQRYVGNNESLQQAIDLAREISRYIWQVYHYTSFGPFKCPSKDELRTADWMVVEFDETRFLNDPTQIIALTGVYLVNTQDTYIASRNPSLFVSGLYPNITDILHHSNHESLEEEWHRTNDDSYINSSQLRCVPRGATVDYHVVPDEVVMQCEEESEGHFGDLVGCLREIYQSNHAL